jgi:hypothetical protein
MPKGDIADRIGRYEDSELTRDEIVDLFVDLFNSRLLFSLQGTYGRTFKHYVNAGWIVVNDKQVAVVGNVPEFV